MEDVNFNIGEPKLRKLLFPLILSLGAASASAEELDRDFSIKYFSGLGGILFPVARPYTSGDILNPKNLRVEFGLKDCLKEGEDVDDYVRTSSPKNSISSVDVSFSGSADIGTGILKTKVEILRTDEPIKEENLEFKKQILYYTNSRIAANVTPDCIKYYSEAAEFATYAEMGIPIDILMTLKGKFTNTSTFQFLGKAGVEIKFSDLLPKISSTSWLKSLLGKIDISAGFEGSYRTIATMTNSYNTGPEELSFHAFRPNYLNLSHYEELQGLLQEFEEEWQRYNNLMHQETAEKTEKETAIAFLEEFPEFSIAREFSLTRYFSNLTSSEDEAKFDILTLSNMKSSPGENWHNSEDDLKHSLAATFSATSTLLQVNWNAGNMEAAE